MGKVDSYSMMIISKYFTQIVDFIHVEMVCKKYKGNMDKFHFNPTVLTKKNEKYFPNIETHYIYGDEERIQSGRIVKYENWKEMNYDEYLKRKEENGGLMVQELIKKVKVTQKDIEQFQVDFNLENDGSNESMEDERDEGEERERERERVEKRIENDKKCTIIDMGCYCDDHYLQTITLPNHITSIRNGIFMNCYGLTHVKLSDMISKIPKCCFKGCTSLQEIKIPFGVDILEQESFMNCINLTRIQIPDHLISIGKHCFTNCNKLKRINIPKSVIEIGDGSFCNCISLEGEIKIEETMNIGKRVFNCCENIEKIVINKQMKELEPYEFSHCVGLKTIEIPTTVTKISKYCFKNCTNLELITLNENMEYESGCFEGCEKLKKILQLDESLFNSLN